MNKNTIKKFPESFIKDCEKNFGVNFAIALHQLKGWAIHIDWGTMDDSLGIDNMKLLRAYVANNLDDVFDFTGIYKIQDYTEKIVRPIQKKVQLSILTRFHTEKQIRESLRYGALVSDKKIKEARKFITNNLSYLKNVPNRANTHIPILDAMNLTYGHCMIYAYAKMIKQNKNPISIYSEKFMEGSEFEANKPGFTHAVSFISNEMMEDVWGIQPLKVILKRFGIEDYYLDDCRENFIKRIEVIKEGNPMFFNEIYYRCISYIENEPKTL